MKDFNAKWKACVARARQAPTRDERAPVGFAARIVARAAHPDIPSLEDVWQHLIVRWLAGAVTLLVLCAVIELPHFRDTQPLDPGIENTVAQLVWSL